MAKKVLALNVDGQLTYCTCPPDKRGIGRCNHVAHQMENESMEEFLNRVNNQMESGNADSESANIDNRGIAPAAQELAHENVAMQNAKPISQEEIDYMAKQIDEIAGCHVTTENFKSVMSKLTPDQVDQISKIGFNAAPVFSLPVRDESYEDENVKNKLYFANLHKFGVAGSSSAIQQMFEAVGATPTHNGKMADIKHSYEEGLTPGEYFAKNYYARQAMITKGIDTAKPGYTARKLFYAFSDMQVMHDCGGPYIDAMHCKLPNGHVCVHCAHMTKGGETVKEGDLIGGVVSTRISEGLTQASMEMKHTGTLDSAEKGKTSAIIMNTLDGWSTSPIIEKMKECETREEMMQTLYLGLKEQYAKANLKMDDFNLQMVAKRLTSFKRDTENGGLRPVEEGERPDIASMLAIGNSNNIFRKVELSAGYKELTIPLEQEIHTDAANQIIN